MQAAAVPRTAPLALWRVAEAFLHLLHSLFGAPEDVARERTLTRAAYTLMLSWLRVGEALLRRLLVIEAAAFPAPTPSHKCTPRQRTRRVMEFTADNPEDWRVSFRTSAVADRRLPAGKPAFRPAQAGDVSDTACRLEAGGPRALLSAWPIAERYEAVLRVFNDPHAYARRLARRLHANPRALETALHEPEHFTDRVDDAEAITSAARAAWPPPDSS